MRIDYLKIENIRNIDSAELKDLKKEGIVLITGPNGSGKSALFDAIRVFKSALGKYSPKRGLNLSSQYSGLVTVGKNSGKITIRISLTKDEQEVLGTEKELLEATANVDINLKVTPSGPDIDLLRNLFSHKFLEKPEVGKIEHIPSDRNFSRGSVSSINFSEDLIEQDRERMIENTSNKYSNLKNDLLWMHLVDLNTRDKGEDIPGYIDGIKNIFHSFLENVEFKDVDIDSRFRRPPSFPVITSRGEHEIDDLSSGQREIVMTYAILEKRKFTNSIILFDEPELHLNGALERRVLTYIKNLSEKGNQFFIATHSPEIIGSVRNERIYRLTDGDPNIAELINLHDEKIKTLRELGATHHIQMISRNIVFVEGDSDQEILNYFDPQIVHQASFVSSGGVGHMLGATELLNRASAFENFRALRDRDDLSEEQVSDLESKANGRMHVWRKRTIENYLLNEIIIYKVITDWNSLKLKDGVDLTTSSKVLEELKKAADQTKDGVIAKVAENRLKKVFSPISVSYQNIEESLKKSLNKREEFFELQKEEKQNEFIREVQEFVDNQWDEHWKDICVAKETLKNFIKNNYQGSANTLYPIFVENICKTMLEDQSIPDEIEQVLRLIRNKQKEK